MYQPPMQLLARLHTPKLADLLHIRQKKCEQPWPCQYNVTAELVQFCPSSDSLLIWLHIVGSHDLAIFYNNLQIQIFVRCMVTPPRSQHLWNSSALEVEVESRRAELQCGRLEGSKGSLVPWPLEEIITAELLLCQKKCTRRSAANTRKGRSFMLRGGVNKQVCVMGNGAALWRTCSLAQTTY